MQLREQVRAPLAEVDDARSHSVGVQGQPQHVDGWLEQVRRAAGEQWRERCVRVDDVPPPVDQHRRIRLVPAQHLRERVADRGERRLVQLVFGIGGRVPAGEK